MTFVDNRAHLVFSEPAYIRNSEENFVHVSFFTQFNHALTINNIVAHMCRTQKILTYSHVI